MKKEAAVVVEYVPVAENIKMWIGENMVSIVYRNEETNEEVKCFYRSEVKTQYGPFQMFSIAADTKDFKQKRNEYAQFITKNIVPLVRDVLVEKGLLDIEKIVLLDRESAIKRNC